MSAINQQSVLNKARKDKFLLTLTPPKVLLPYAKDLGINELQMSVYGSPAPAISIPSITQDYKGQHLKVSSFTRQDYPDLNVLFTIDNEYQNYWFMWKWMDVLNLAAESGADEYFNAHRMIEGNAALSRGVLYKDTPTEVSYTESINKRQSLGISLDYQADLTLYALDEYNRKKVKFTYKMAFPTDIGEISYSYRDAEECECSISFAYSQFLPELVKCE